MGWFSSSTPQLHPPPKNQKKVLYIVLTILFINSLNFTILVPYSPFLLRRFYGIPEHQVAGKSGILVGMFSLGRLLTTIPAGKLSDSIGRKPLLLASSLLVAMCSVAFAFVPSFEWAVAIRTLAGAASFLLPLAKTVLRETSTGETQTNAFKLVGVAVGVSMLGSPFVGASLAEPQNSWLGDCIGCVDDDCFFGDSNFPFALPPLFLALMNIVSFFLVTQLPETCTEALANRRKKLGLVGDIGFESAALLLPSGPIGFHGDAHEGEDDFPPMPLSPPSGPSDRHQEPHYDHPDNLMAIQSDGFGEFLSDLSEGEEDYNPDIGKFSSQKTKDDTSVLGLFKESKVLFPMMLYPLFAMVYIMYDESFALWSTYSLEDGGLGFTATDTGLLMSASAIPSLLFSLYLYEPIVRKIGLLRTYQAGSLLTLPLFCTVPFWNDVAVTGVDWRVVRGLCFLTMVLANFCANLSFTASMIIGSNSVVPTRAATLQSTAMCLAAVGRTVGPIVSGIVLDATSGARGAHPFPWDHHAVFFLVAVLSLLTLVLSLNTNLIPWSVEHRAEDLSENGGKLVLSASGRSVVSRDGTGAAARFLESSPLSSNDSRGSNLTSDETSMTSNRTSLASSLRGHGSRGGSRRVSWAPMETREAIDSPLLQQGSHLLGTRSYDRISSSPEGPHTREIGREAVDDLFQEGVQSVDG